MRPASWALLGVVLAGAGWRGDGTGTFPKAASAAGAPTTSCWRNPLPWSNASPSHAGGLVCTMAEPTDVVCADAATGAVRWRASNGVVQTLPALAQADLTARLAEVPALEAARRQHQADLSAARRALRSGGDAAALEAAAQGLESVHARLVALAPYLTPDDPDRIGYTSATPLLTDDAVFVHLGNGVVSRFDLRGTRRWSVWLGPPPAPLRGFDHGGTASPQLVDGVLVVAHGALQGLDPETGGVRWTGPTYRDYGTPAVTTVGGVGVVATPDGHLVRARDGKVLASGLADVWYGGPVAVGETLLYAGGSGMESSRDPTHATRIDLARVGDEVTATQRWRVQMPTTTRIYGAPLVHDGKVWVHVRDGLLVVLDLDDGGLVWQGEAIPGATTEAWAGPSRVGDQLVLTTRGGVVAAGPTVTPFKPSWVHRLDEEMRGSPWFAGDAVYVRTMDALACLRP